VSARTQPIDEPGNFAANTSGYRATSAWLRAVLRTTQSSAAIDAPPRGGGAFQIRHLARAGPAAFAHVAERVPALDIDDHALDIRPEAHIARPPGLARLRRHLELRREASASRERDHDILHRKVSRVGDIVGWVPSDGEHERHPERDSDPLDRFEIERSLASLSTSDDRPPDPGTARELGLRPLASAADRPDVTAQPRPPLPRPRLRLGGHDGSSPCHRNLLCGPRRPATGARRSRLALGVFIT
jgi:hypothetical protein